MLLLILIVLWISSEHVSETEKSWVSRFMQISHVMHHFASSSIGSDFNLGNLMLWVFVALVMVTGGIGIVKI